MKPPLLHDIFRAVDKIQKKSKDEILQEYKTKGIFSRKIGENIRVFKS